MNNLSLHSKRQFFYFYWIQIVFSSCNECPVKILSGQSGGLSLHSEIISLSFNTCAPHISKRDRLKPVNNISAYQFKKHRIKLKVHWQLKSNRDQDVIYEKTTFFSQNF